MAFSTGFWANGVQGSPANMNLCLLGWGLYSEFPAAAAGNKGALALATDKGMVYYSNGTAWTLAAVVPPASLAQGDSLYFDGTIWQKLTKTPVDVTASRALGVEYRNTNKYPILVQVTAAIAGTALDMLYVYVKSTSPANTQAGSILLYNNGSVGGSGAQNMGTFIVPPGYYYQLTDWSGPASLIKWIETPN